MPILSKPSGAVPTAVIYITLGALLVVWPGVWWWFVPPVSSNGWFWLTGFFITGVVLLAIGLLLGRIGRSARNAELPPEEVTPSVASTDRAAATKQPVVQTVQAKPGEVRVAPVVSGTPTTLAKSAPAAKVPW